MPLWRTGDSPSYERPLWVVLLAALTSVGFEDSSMPFPHRVNGDGTVDSICDVCFATVGTSRSEEDLASFEASHLCEADRVAYYQTLESTTYQRPLRWRAEQGQ